MIRVSRASEQSVSRSLHCVNTREPINGRGVAIYLRKLQTVDVKELLIIVGETLSLGYRTP